MNRFEGEHMSGMDEQTRHHLTLQLGRLYIAILQLRRHLRQELGISQNAAIVLEFLRLCHPEPVRTTDLAMACGIAPSALTKTLVGLEQKRFVRRAADHNDRRVVNVSIDDAYVDVLDRHIQAFSGSLEQVLSRIHRDHVSGLTLLVADLVAGVEEIVDRATRGSLVSSDAERRIAPT